jgi:Zn-finger nucleic acid-binding protein
LTDLAIDPTANVHACATCRGLFVPARAWHQLSAEEELVVSLQKLLPTAAAPSSVRPDTRLFACPDCSSEMERMRFAATSQIVIDACTGQHGLWLDAGALAPALAYAKHRRAIGAEAARREAEAFERAQPGGDPVRRQHEIALAMARERQERAAQGRFEAPAAPPGKRHYTLFAVVGLMALFYISLSAKDCSKHGRSRQSDAPDTNVKTLQQRP